MATTEKQRESGIYRVRAVCLQREGRPPRTVVRAFCLRADGRQDGRCHGHIILDRRYADTAAIIPGEAETRATLIKFGWPENLARDCAILACQRTDSA